MALTFSRLGKTQSQTRVPTKPVSAPIVQDEEGNLFISLGNFASLEEATVQRNRKTKDGSTGTPYEGVDLVDVEGLITKVIDVPSNAQDAAGRQLLAAAATDGVIPRDGETLRATLTLRLHLPRSTGWLGIDPESARWSIVQPASVSTSANAKPSPKVPRKVKVAKK